MDEYLDGRRDEKVYRIVYEHFIPAISSSEHYKAALTTRLTNPAYNKELFTKSDEAFTLLLLENYFERWMDIYKENGGHIPTARGSRKKVNQSQVRPKYTSGGNVYQEGTSNSERILTARGKGWDIAGIKRYNELFERVEADRKKCPLFIKRWLKDKRESKEEIKKAKPRKTKEIVLPRSELGEEEFDLEQEMAAMNTSQTKKEEQSFSSEENESDQSTIVPV